VLPIDASPPGQILPGLGGYPSGDTDAIRAVAARLRGVAGPLAAVPRPQLRGWRSATATHTAAALDAAAGTADTVAGELRLLAAALDSAAHTLEIDQAAWRAAKRRLETP
jgi:hypothetical protein